MSIEFFQKANGTVLWLELEGFFETASALRKVISDVEVQTMAVEKLKQADIVQSDSTPI